MASGGLFANIQAGHYKQVRYILRSGLNPNIKGPDGYNCLVAALHIKDPAKRAKMVNLLLFYEASCQAVDHMTGRDVITWACTLNVTDEIKNILDKGRNLIIFHRQDNSGYSALHYSVKHDNADATNMLCKEMHRLGLSVDFVDKDGLTPYLLAVRLGRLTCAAILEKKGYANISQRDAFLCQPAQYWTQIGQSEKNNNEKKQTQKQIEKLKILGREHQIRQAQFDIHNIKMVKSKTEQDILQPERRQNANLTVKNISSNILDKMDENSVKSEENGIMDDSSKNDILNADRHKNALLELSSQNQSLGDLSQESTFIEYIPQKKQSKADIRKNDSNVGNLNDVALYKRRTSVSHISLPVIRTDQNSSIVREDSDKDVVVDNRRQSLPVLPDINPDLDIKKEKTSENVNLKRKYNSEILLPQSSMERSSTIQSDGFTKLVVHPEESMDIGNGIGMKDSYSANMAMPVQPHTYYLIMHDDHIISAIDAERKMSLDPALLLTDVPDVSCSSSYLAPMLNLLAHQKSPSYRQAAKPRLVTHHKSKTKPQKGAHKTKASVEKFEKTVEEEDEGDEAEIKAVTRKGSPVPMKNTHRIKGRTRKDHR